MLRQLAVVAALFGIMTFLPTLAGVPTESVNPASMAAFGFIVLAAYSLGKLAERVRLPHITGYLVTGLVCGPHVLALLDDRVVRDLKLFDVLAVALIGFSAGGSLKLSSLRRGLKTITGVIGAQTLVVMVGIALLVGVMALPIPGIGLQILHEGGWGRVLAVALVLGTIAVAFSPAATIAVINGAKARGPFSDSVLGVSILNNVVVVAVFAATIALSQRMVGQGGDGQLIAEILITLGGSVGLGLVLGLGLALYLRFVGSQLLLLVVGLCFLVTWIAQQTGTEPVLVFIVAGFVFSNASPRSQALLAVVERLSLPVYVVFFFTAGAGLHLDALAALWPAALLLFVGRLASLHIGTSLGARLFGGPDALKRHGWMAFGPQAGIALSLATVAGRTFEGWGETLETLAVAAIALNELVGPALLQVSLGLAGERQTERTESKPSAPPTGEPASSEPTEDSSPSSRLPEWLPEPGRPLRDPWGPPPTCRDPRLLKAVGATRRDLEEIVRELRAGPVGLRREQAVRFLGLLRREFLRAHRHTSVALDSRREDAWVIALRRERAGLAVRWERLLLDRAATTDFRQDLNTFQNIIAKVDAVVERVPEALEVPLDPTWADPHEDEGLRLATARWWLRTRQRTASLVGSARAPSRVIELRALARFNLSGLAVTGIAEPAALVAMGERHLLARARAIFEAYHQALEALQKSATPADERAAALEAVRAELEEDFALASREIDRMADEMVRVTASVLGRAYRALVVMSDGAGTPELPPARYRISRIYDARQAAMQRVEEGFSISREMTRGIANGLAMELEMVRLRVQLQESVEAAAIGLSRDVRGRLLIQIERLSEALSKAVTSLARLLSGEERSRARLRPALGEATAPLTHILGEVLAIGEKLRSAIKNESPLSSLQQAINAGIDDLTDRFLVITDAPSPHGRAFPVRVAGRDLHFREAVRAYMEAEAGRDLTVALAEVRGRVDEATVGVDEVQRVLAFNSDLAGAELDVLPDDVLADETLDLLREMLVGTLQRLAHRVQALKVATEPLAEQAETGIRTAVNGNLERLTGILVEGRHGELRLRLALDTASSGGRELHSHMLEVAKAFHQVLQVLSVALGPRTIARARAVLGLPEVGEHGPGTPSSFSPPSERVPIPTVYRRLFSDQALEGGDLLTGREGEVERVRRVLQGRGRGRSRAVVVVGQAGISNTAVLNTLLRGLRDDVRVHRVELTQPVIAQEVAERILTPLRNEHDHVMVIEGIQWLFTIRPGGFTPLAALLEGVLADRGRNGWLVSTEQAVWSYAARVLPLEDVLCERLDLNPLSVDELRSTLLLRHAMSGYRLHFERPAGHLGWWLKGLIGRRTPEDELHERHFFEELHQATGGILSDALRMWLASVAGVGSSTDTITIGALPTPPLESLRKLPLEELICLRQLARQGRITAEDHARQFRDEPTWSASTLARLEHRGLLQGVDEGCFRLAPDLAGAIHQVLRERGLLG